MRKPLIYFLIWALGVLQPVFADDEIVLNENSIGSMKIEPGMKISLYKIWGEFSKYKVSHEINEGDSPDYHRFIVATHSGESLVSFISYIENASEYEQARVELDEVVVHSNKIKDQYGVRVGMNISTALRLRGGDLDFGIGHIDNYLGKNKIWNLFSVEDKHGVSVTKEMALKVDPEISAITWPYPRWR